jgi:adenylosuccinate synthase
VTEYPADGANLEGVVPIYESFPGWTEDLTAATSLADLPGNCINYVRFMQKQMGVPVVSLSVGPGRSQSFECEISEVVNA